MTHKKNNNVLFLSLTSFFQDVSSEMIFSIMPLFMSALGLSKTTIGVIEGITEATASIFKTISGWVSDRVQAKKPLVVIGYTLSTIVKPFLALTNFWYQVLAVRFLDRVGKGIRNAPRDALIADSIKEKDWCSAFGMNRAFDSAGAVVGTLLAAVLLFYFSDYLKLDILNQYRTIFWVSVIPGVVAILMVAIFVRDIRQTIEIKEVIKTDLSGFKRQFKIFLFISGLLELAKFSYVFFVLRAYGLGVPAYLIPMIYLAFNIIYAAAAQPVGQFADRVGLKKVLLLGYILFCFNHLGFAFATTSMQVWLFFVLYGVSMAVLEVVPRAMVAHFSPHNKRATAFGYYYTTIGLAALPATAIAGMLWDSIDPSTAFLYGATVALLAAVMLEFGIRENPARGISQNVSTKRV